MDTTTEHENLNCNSGALAEAHGALFQALGELAAALDAANDTLAAKAVRDRIVDTIAHVGNARRCLIAAVREVCPEVEGLTLAADAAVTGRAA